MEQAPIAAGPLEASVRLRDLPPEGSALRKLGAWLAELLEEDQWAECERRLFDVADEQKSAIENAAYRSMVSARISYRGFSYGTSSQWGIDSLRKAIERNGDA